MILGNTMNNLKMSTLTYLRIQQTICMKVFASNNIEICLEKHASNQKFKFALSYMYLYRNN